MSSIVDLVEGLQGDDQNQAYWCLRKLEKESAFSSAIYTYFSTLVEMLASPNSYVRTRAILLIAANAKWDVDYKIDEIIDGLLKHITDVKPVTARQCIKALPVIAEQKPELRSCIEQALLRANVSHYSESMRPLVAKDIQAPLRQLRK